MAGAKVHDAATEQRGRITARVSQSVTQMIESAADLVGATINQFVIQAALEKAEKVMEKEQLRLSQEDKSWLFSLLENPPEPTADLVTDFTAYKARKTQPTDENRNPTFEFNP